MDGWMLKMMGKVGGLCFFIVIQGADVTDLTFNALVTALEIAIVQYLTWKKSTETTESPRLQWLHKVELGHRYPLGRMQNSGFFCHGKLHMTTQDAPLQELLLMMFWNEAVEQCEVGTLVWAQSWGSLFLQY